MLIVEIIFTLALAVAAACVDWKELTKPETDKVLE